MAEIIGLILIGVCLVNICVLNRLERQIQKGHDRKMRIVSELRGTLTASAPRTPPPPKPRR